MRVNYTIILYKYFQNLTRIAVPAKPDGGYMAIPALKWFRRSFWVKLRY